MANEPDMTDHLYSQVGALEAEVERLSRENTRLWMENRALRGRLYLNDLPYHVPSEDEELRTLFREQVAQMKLKLFNERKDSEDAP